jgi:hypothetical protein
VNNFMRAPFEVHYVAFAYFAVILAFAISLLRILFGAFDNGLAGILAFFVLLPIFFKASFWENSNNTILYDEFFGFKILSALILIFFLWVLAMDYLNIVGPDDQEDWKSILVIFSIVISADSAVTLLKKSSST